MYEYLTTHNLSNLQFGFRPLHFTLTALLDATDQWYTNMDNGLINESCLLLAGAPVPQTSIGFGLHFSWITDSGSPIVDSHKIEY
jgi:hypothetical protein